MNRGAQTLHNPTARRRPQIDNSAGLIDTLLHSVLVCERFVYQSIERNSRKHCLERFQTLLGSGLKKTDPDTMFLGRLRTSRLDHVARHTVLEPDVVIRVAEGSACDQSPKYVFGGIEMEKYLKRFRNAHALKRSERAAVEKALFKSLPGNLDRTLRGEHHHITHDRAEHHKVWKHIVNRCQND